MKPDSQNILLWAVEVREFKRGGVRDPVACMPQDAFHLGHSEQSQMMTNSFTYLFGKCFLSTYMVPNKGPGGQQ